MNVIVRPAIVDSWYVVARAVLSFRTVLRGYRYQYFEIGSAFDFSHRATLQLAKREQIGRRLRPAKIKSGWQIRWADKIEFKKRIHFRRKSLAINNSRIRNPLK